MKKIIQFSSQREAQIAADALIGAGIAAKVMGAREYTSIYLGTDFGSFNLLVPEKEVATALAAMDRFQALNSNENKITPDAKTYFKKAVIFSLLAAVILPVVFNFVAISNLRQFLALEKKSSARAGGMIMIALLQVPTFIIWTVLIRNFLTHWQ